VLAGWSLRGGAVADEGRPMVYKMVKNPVRKVGPWFIKNIKKPDGFCEDRENRTDFIGLPKTGPLELKMFQTAK
jgi:hypothetical protein